MQQMAHTMDAQLSANFEEADILVARADAPGRVVPGNLWRSKITGVFFDEGAMLEFMAKKNKNFPRNYRIIKLARERNLVR